MVDGLTTDLLTSLDTARTAADVWTVTGRHLSGLGLTHSIYSFVDPGAPTEARFWTSLPESWRDHYVERHYHQIDPFFRYCCGSFAPVRTGTAYLPDHTFLTRQERRFINEGGEVGFRAGFSAPVRLRGSGSFGGWNFGSAFGRQEFEMFLRTYGEHLRFAAFVVHEHLQRATGKAQSTSKLTPRERECLLWLSLGLRTTAIADRMNIADVTVDHHFRGARRKLGAATREEALAKAILTKQIRP
ncbi:helix-turn-helix transcriptional regulator [Bauldia sp.]|uniref:helix-turn-helix transcriptional regulator n=1 Tax=Bauldia sp. TaxID=2575872 RepID=UPI003BAAABFC